MLRLAQAKTYEGAFGVKNCVMCLANDHGLMYRHRITKTNQMNDDMCPICYDSLENGEVKITDCNHTFHRSCIKQWIKQKRVNGTVPCPMCRAPLRKPVPALEILVAPQTPIGPLPIRIQCTGITKRGTQCKFKARAGMTRCGHHMNQVSQPLGIIDHIWLAIIS